MAAFRSHKDADGCIWIAKVMQSVVDRGDSMDQMIEELRKLTVRTKSGRLRALMPVIEERLAAGVSQQDIVNVLREAGIDLTLGTFKSYLHRHRAKLRDHPSSRALANPAPSRLATGLSTDADTPVIEIDVEEASSDALSDQSTLADILDARKRDAFADKYMNQRRPLFGRNRS